MTNNKNNGQNCVSTSASELTGVEATVSFSLFEPFDNDDVSLGGCSTDAVLTISGDTGHLERNADWCSGALYRTENDFKATPELLQSIYDLLNKFLCQPEATKPSPFYGDTPQEDGEDALFHWEDGEWKTYLDEMKLVSTERTGS